MYRIRTEQSLSNTLKTPVRRERLPRSLPMTFSLRGKPRNPIWRSASCWRPMMNPILSLPNYPPSSVCLWSRSPLCRRLYRLEHGYPQKRLRLDTDNNRGGLDMIRHLPRPAQKDDRQNRPAPLPAGHGDRPLHEPPPSAALLPSIDVESRPALARSSTTSKIHVKDMLTEPVQGPSSRLGSSVQSTGQPSSSTNKSLATDSPAPAHEASPGFREPKTSVAPWKDSKQRRARRKWTEKETNDLLLGVKKYGRGQVEANFGRRHLQLQ